jgi:hypothetical protein
MDALGEQLEDIIMLDRAFIMGITRSSYVFT